MDKKALRTIPIKNYLILGVIIVVTLLLLYYFYMWIDAYNETKLNRPILDKYMEVINYNELDDYLVENPDTVIYVSRLEDKTIREFEKQVKTALRKHEITRELLYMDITSLISNKKIRNEMIDKYNNGLLNMTNVPVVIVFENGQVRDIYGVSESYYDIDMFKQFVNGIAFSNEDELDG